MNSKPARLIRMCTAAALAVALPLSAGAMNPSPGMPVKKIPFASQIDSWQALDKRRLILTVSPKRNYLLTLRNDCHSLNFANHVGVSTSGNTIYAGFDYVTADGQRCAIQSISEISKDQKKALTQA